MSRGFDIHLWNGVLVFHCIANEHYGTKYDQKYSVAYGEYCCKITSARKRWNKIRFEDDKSSELRNWDVQRCACVKINLKVFDLEHLNFFTQMSLVNCSFQLQIFFRPGKTSHSIHTSNSRTHLVCLDFSSSLDGGGMCSGSGIICVCTSDGWYDTARL